MRRSLASAEGALQRVLRAAAAAEERKTVAEAARNPVERRTGHSSLALHSQSQSHSHSQSQSQSQSQWQSQWSWSRVPSRGDPLRHLSHWEAGPTGSRVDWQGMCAGNARGCACTIRGNAIGHAHGYSTNAFTKSPSVGAAKRSLGRKEQAVESRRSAAEKKKSLADPHGSGSTSSLGMAEHIYPIPLDDHGAGGKYEYRVEVHTGELRGAGTTSNVFLNVLGDLGSTGAFLLRSPEDDGEIEEFRTGSEKVFHLSLPSLLGRISALDLRVERDASSISAREGWYVEKLLVYSPTGKRWEFPCKCWFGESDCGGFDGPMERRLVPFVKPEHAQLRNFGKRLPRPLSTSSGVFVVPHPDKVKDGVKATNGQNFGFGGEDAYFKCLSDDGRTIGFGVADGVYMWQTNGIDAGQFSRELMTLAREEVKSGATSINDVVKRAAEGVQDNKIQGSCTLCISLLDLERGTMQNATLGDSGVLVLGKDGFTKFKTPPQEHAFGCPYQLGHHQGADKPWDVLTSVVPVSKGDIIITGTDGLFDNVSEEDAGVTVVEVLSSHPAGHPMLASLLANALGKRAFHNSVSKKITTPYSKAATDAFNMVYSGGKKDDITVITTIIQ